MHFLRGAASQTAILAPGRSPLQYQALEQLIADVGGRLRAAGIGRNDRVVLITPNGPEAATAFLAIAGVCECAPLNPAYRDAELTYYLNDLRPKLVVHADDVPPAAAAAAGIRTAQLRVDPSAPAGVFSLPDLPAAGAAVDDDLNAIALLLHTSGTTSRPKLVPLTWTNLLTSADNVGATLQLTPADRCLNVMPLFHIHGLVAALLSTLRAGGSIVCTPGLVATSFFDWMDEFTPTWYSAVPTMHQSILARAPRHPESLERSRLRFVRSSSAPLPVVVLHELESTFRVPVVEAYGMTEAAHQMASNPLPPATRKPGSVGRAAGPEVTVLNNDGEYAGAGVEGHVCIRGANVTAGYRENAAANDEAFRNGWFYTGDLGQMDADGYLFLTGRSKEIINRGGEKISPREVDEILMTHAAVRQCLTFALPDSQLGEEVGAVVVGRENTPLSETELQHFAAARLADFKVPRRIFFLDAIPTGPTGKLQRVGLAQRLGITADSWKPRAHAQETIDAGVTATVGRIMAAVLGVSTLDQQTGFFDAGGDSLLATRLLTGLEHEFQKKLTMVDLFASSSPAAIAAALASRPVIAQPAVLPRRDSEELTLSAGQVRLWLHGLLDEHNLAAQTPRLFEIRGHIDPEHVRASLVQIVNRHEPLRTVISNEGGVPRPRLRPAEPLPWTVHDWTGVPLDRREASAREVCLRDSSERFRLDTDLLLRASLHKLADDRWWLLVLMHHSANDGWSSQVLRGELQTLLEGGALPALSASYSDFARLQAASLATEHHAGNMKYWAAQLEGLPPLLELPIEFTRPAMQTYNGGVVSSLIPASLTRQVQDLSRSRRTTLFMSLLAVWSCLLSRYAGANDISVGTPVAGRSRPEFEPLIGLFMNNLVLRLRLDGTPTFDELLERVRETCLGAWDHDVPFERLLQELPPERSAAHSPYFQVYFQLRNFPRATPSATLPVTELELDFDIVPTDLNLEVTETAEGLRCRLAYNASLFTERFAKAMLAHYEVLLGAAIANPGTLISQLPIISADERAAIVSRSQALYRPRAHATVVELFERQARDRAGEVAVLHPGGKITYGALNAQANRLARVLTRAGAGPDQVVALCMDRSPEWITAMIGVAKSGAAYVSIDPEHPAALVRDLIERARATLVIADERCRSTLAGCNVPVIWPADLQNAAAEDGETNPPLAASPHHLVHLFFTSGSTGRPKGVATEHRNLSAYLAGYHWMSFAPSDTCLQFTSSTFDPCAAEVWGPLTHGGRCAIYGEGLGDVGRLGAWIRDSGVTMCFFSASVFNTLIDEAPEVLLPVRRILAGGEALSAPHIRRALDLLPRSEIINGYGPTETTIYFTGYRVPRPFDRQLTSVPIGRPIDNGAAYVLDQTRNLLPDGLPGDLWLGGDTVGRGYLHDVDATAAAFIPDPIAAIDGARLYRSGDRARWSADGQLEFLGRTDHQVKIRGVRIELGEIEAVLREHPAVQHAVVIATPHPSMGNMLSGFVELRDGAAITGADLRTYLSSRLASQMVPPRIEVLASLPLNASGKINRQELTRRAREQRDAEPVRASTTPPKAVDARLLPVPDVERRLAAIWRGLLDVQDLSSKDDFFALGGHSLLAVKLAFQIEREFGRNVTLAAMFESSTLGEMAALIGDRDAAPTAAPTAGSESTLPPLLCIAAGPLFRPFADALAPDCRFHSVPTPAIADDNRVASMEDLGARIVPGIINAHPTEPLMLAGWSLAGVVALEVATQLERAGREIKAVILFDTLSPVRQREWFARSPMLRQWQLNAIKTWYHAEEAMQRGPAGAIQYLLSSLRDARARSEYDRLLRQASSGKRDFDIPLRFKTAFGLQAAHYTPSPLQARVILVRPQRRKRGALFAGDLGWSELGYKVDLVTVPGDHEQMFSRSNASILATELLATLRR